MIKIDIKGGYIEFPDEWIIVNIAGYDMPTPKECEYVGITSCPNPNCKNRIYFVFFLREPLSEMENEVEVILYYCKRFCQMSCRRKHNDFSKDFCSVHPCESDALHNTAGGTMRLYDMSVMEDYNMMKCHELKIVKERIKNEYGG